jgi:hypothetical protein
VTISKKTLALAATSLFAAGAAFAAGDAGETVGDDVIAAQRAALAASSAGKGFGPQTPRDLDSPAGENANLFTLAQPYTNMHLCNIHFHDAAEHKGGEFTTYVGNGDGAGVNTGYKYDGTLTEAEMAAFDGQIGDGSYGGLQVGDTIEQHYVHTSAPITPGPTLGSCLNGDVNINPTLRVETVVFVIVNDDNAGDMVELNAVEMVDGYWQAPNIPNDLGDRYIYTGSTTGPSYNEKASPIQVTWSVRPQVMKVSASSVAAWRSDNQFDETGAHAVRNLVVNPALLSTMQ